MRGLFWKQKLAAEIEEKNAAARYWFKTELEVDKRIIKVLDQLKEELKNAPDPVSKVQELRDKCAEHKAYCIEQIAGLM